MKAAVLLLERESELLHSPCVVCACLLGTDTARGCPRHTCCWDQASSMNWTVAAGFVLKSSLTLTWIMLGPSWSLISSGSEAYTRCAKLYMLLVLGPLCLACQEWGIWFMRLWLFRDLILIRNLVASSVLIPGGINLLLFSMFGLH